MPDPVLEDISHRRYNPLLESCYLCPGNHRAQDDVNPNYEKTFVFVNDYSAVKEQQEQYEPESGGLESQLLRAEAVTGKCYVIAFSPSHNLTLADMSPKEICPIIKTWTKLYAAHLSPRSPLASVASPTTFPPLGSGEAAIKPQAQYRYMQIFENKGAAMGCSNPHPHGQIWTVTGMPDEPASELRNLQSYRAQNHGRHMLEDYARMEADKEERVVFQNDAFLALCPWWATWPFEVMIVSKQHMRALVDLNETGREQLAEAIAEVARGYDNLFETQFPYSMGVHQAPLEGTVAEIESSYFHIHFYPPLLRSATVRKFLVGYELLAEPQRDITPEQAAMRLRDCGGELYRKKIPS
ncbi:MAG: galactose-1-phosphate uridyl transferase [Caeruleum heppii]|nr:MAG: galactose-1-phosphate uridyl transferase [Caeruleum heppii]